MEYIIGHHHSLTPESIGSASVDKTNHRDSICGWVNPLWKLQAWRADCTRFCLILWLESESHQRQKEINEYDLHPNQNCGYKNRGLGNFLAVQWLRLCASIAGGLGSFPGQGTRIPQAMCGMAKKNKTKSNQSTPKKQGASLQAMVCKPLF